ncbi:hypothetical protein C943_01938 [Mariniradius saccharolyticus AK6]|uniref:Uncharacterized protein n=1 Tax=Mariniradius saccharolyticus AK6 TaxID=1239962 RepID=M7XT27_9BACT|nr:hypothetical protein C943_01938 [Mariniradius saccharolyticus AK6]
MGFRTAIGVNLLTCRCIRTLVYIIKYAVIVRVFLGISASIYIHGSTGGSIGAKVVCVRNSV